MPAAVVILPHPLSPAALFGYGILRFLGHIDVDTHARFTRIVGSNSRLSTCEGKIVELRLKTGDLYREVLGLIGSDPRLKRILTFASFGDKEAHERLGTVLHKLNMGNSKKALCQVADMIAVSMETQTDMWKYMKGFETFVLSLESLVQPRPHRNYPTHQDFLSLPVFKGKGIRKEEDITDSFEVVIEEGRICTLQDKHIGIVIGGPPGSGKSTLAESLVIPMRNCIRKLRTREGFANLDVSVEVSTLDLATETNKGIAEGWASTDPERLLRIKRPWTPKLVKTAQRRFLDTRKKCNIVLGDLPGGTVDEITEVLTSAADACIIISNDWDVVQEEWIPLMRDMGVPIISKVRRRENGDGYSSLVTSWRRGERLSGRVTALNRNQKSWDPFIQWLAVFLLFDILPTMFGEE